MRVRLDLSVLKLGHKNRGVGYYTENLLNHLKLQPEIEIVGQKDKADLIHYPFFDLFYHTLPFKKSAPTVVTIHDITPLLFSRHYPPGIKGLINLSLQKLSLKNVDAVITVSNASKKDIVSYFNIDPKKVFVTYEAASKDYRVIKDSNQLKEVRSEFKLPERFVLFVGNVNWNKNLNNLAQACLDADLDLVIVGKSFTQKENLNHPEMKSYQQFLKSFDNNPKIHSLGYLETEDLVRIMNIAELLLFPSFYEGFGLPILEAQSCGLPVITSNNSSLPEVSGDGAILVDPYNLEEITNSIKILLKDKDLKQKLINAGLENAKRFSWDKTAQQTLEVYKYATKD